MPLTKVKKNAQQVVIAKSDDPEFNQEFAQRMANMVMKMDEEDARLFTSMVVGDVLDQTIEKNLRTLQQHVNRVSKRQIEKIKKALVTAVSKSDDQQAVEFAKALTLIEKANAWQNPYETGAYRFRESDFRRDPGTGQFRAKVRVNPDAKPLSRGQAANLGIKPEDTKGLSAAQKAQYQQEWMQVSNFLNTVAGSGNPGDHKIFMEVRDKATNSRYYKEVNGRPKLDPKTETVVSVEAKPASLTLGGAAFGLTRSLGGGNLSGSTVNMITRGENAMPGFANEWTADTDMYSSNSRLYSNVGAASRFLGQVAPRGSHAQIAAKFGEFAGSHGAEAEKVFGPVTRRAAYRYRGVEKKPPRKLIRDYEHAMRSGQQRDLLRSEAARQQPGGILLTPDQRDELKARISDMQNEVRNRRWVEANRGREEAIPRMERGEPTLTGEEGRMGPNFIPLRDIKLSTSDRKQIEAGVRRQFYEELRAEQEKKVVPEAALAGGREVLANYLKENMPERGLYGLHLDAGNTPPSEGFLINADGEIVAQAVGYGDDHYLPFNLKNMTKLKGGEYIRTRSVGGPTSEDIYTGLMMGARSLTVISRSGTFTVDFEDDFRGGRRYNDKAARMVGRYQRILDSVQSEQVDREAIDPAMRAAITRQVRQQREGFPAGEIREEITRRLNEYKADPELSGPDEAALDSYIERFTSGMSEQEAKRAAGEIRNRMAADKEYKYRLNGFGYESALQALEEQFPYYIKTKSVPTKAPEHVELERDKGYVEPGRNRPTQAASGWHGTAGVKGNRYGNAGEKFSASHADFQRGKYGVAKPTLRPVTPEEEEKKKAEEKKKVAGVTAIGARVAEEKARDELAEIAIEINNSGLRTAWSAMPEGPEKKRMAVFGMTDQEVRTYLKDPKNTRTYHDILQDPAIRERITTEQQLKYDRAANKIDRKEYTDEEGLIKGNRPFLFSSEGPAYQAGADAAHVREAVSKLDIYHPISQDKKPSEMTDKEIDIELDALYNMSRAIENIKPGDDAEAKDNLLKAFGLTPNAAARRMITNPKELTAAARTMQKMRTLNLNRPEERKPGTEQVITAAPRGTGAADAGRERVNQMVKDLSEQANALQEQRNPATAGFLANIAQDAKKFVQDIVDDPDHPGPIEDAEIEAWLDENPQRRRAISIMEEEKARPRRDFRPRHLDVRGS